MAGGFVVACGGAAAVGEFDFMVLGFGKVVLVGGVFEERGRFLDVDVR